MASWPSMFSLMILRSDQHTFYTYKGEDSHFKTPSACLLGSSTVQTSIVSVPRRHSSFVFRSTRCLARDSSSLLSCGKGMSAGSVLDDDVFACKSVVLRVLVMARKKGRSRRARKWKTFRPTLPPKLSLLVSDCQSDIVTACCVS